MGRRFPSELRYGEPPSDIGLYVKVLLKAAFTTRRLVKRHLKPRKEENQ